MRCLDIYPLGRGVRVFFLKIPWETRGGKSFHTGVGKIFKFRASVPKGCPGMGIVYDRNGFLPNRTDTETWGKKLPNRTYRNSRTCLNLPKLAETTEPTDITEPNRTNSFGKFRLFRLVSVGSARFGSVVSAVSIGSVVSVVSVR